MVKLVVVSTMAYFQVELLNNTLIWTYWWGRSPRTGLGGEGAPSRYFKACTEVQY